MKVNRNHLWASVFINQLAEAGVKYACISPGSRSTPLTYSLATNKKIKCFVHIDERSSGFFALGLAKASGLPTIIVTTSGTATAELYPAIIEAYQQRTPLIVCTADRPPELIGTGANQTINQHNLYRNHIRWFRDIGLPSVTNYGLKHLQRIALEASELSTMLDRGPVHFNFPFRKPLEPFSYTDEVGKNIFKMKPIENKKHRKLNFDNLARDRRFRNLLNKCVESEKGLIIAGPMEYDSEAVKKIKQLSSVLKYPLIADGSSHLRFGIKKSGANVFSNYHSYLLSPKFCEDHKPEVVIHFGRTVTSSSLENYLNNTDAERYLVNEYGDCFDPSGKTKAIFKTTYDMFCSEILSELNGLSNSDWYERRKKSEWLKDFLRAENISGSLKNKIITKSRFPNEPNAIIEILNSIPKNANIIVGNSLPIRDLDWFADKSDKKFVIHFNRGASGIDGIVSTALGISAVKKTTFLIVGDLSFLHDMNSLQTAVKYSLPLKIILINNNGGGIFETLPISQREKSLREYFVTPHNLDLEKIVASFGIKYKLVNKRNLLHQIIKKEIKQRSPLILEIRTDSVESAKQRNHFFEEVKKRINTEFS